MHDLEGLTHRLEISDVLAFELGPNALELPDGLL
jgi:hypothetical protein